ncbi:hypothetical protein [Streptomyces rochei]|uniref:hypothetical protein n=1 Tax=Streptomyces rochei TaxID=1928 RepID=UPI00117EF143|nr:hypothetical protein [Streptomyces rochei]
MEKLTQIGRLAPAGLRTAKHGQDLPEVVQLPPRPEQHRLALALAVGRLFHLRGQAVNDGSRSLVLIGPASGKVRRPAGVLKYVPLVAFSFWCVWSALWRGLTTRTRTKTGVTTQTLIMFLFLGASVSLNGALIAGILARLNSSTTLRAILVAGPAFIAIFSLFIAAWGNLT